MNSVLAKPVIRGERSFCPACARRREGGQGAHHAKHPFAATLCLGLACLGLAATSAGALEMPRVGRWKSPHAEGGAEVVVWAAGCQRAAVLDVAGYAIQFLDLDDPTNPRPTARPSLADLGPSPTSLAAHGDLIAVTVAGAPGQPGQLAIYNCDGDRLDRITTGQHPDAVSFTPDGLRLVTADEGELAGDIDPAGGFTVVDLDPERRHMIAARVGTFAAFDPGGPRSSELPAGLRLDPQRLPSRDLEPEYVAIAPDGTTAWLTLQEASGIVEVDIESATIRRIVALAPADFSQQGAGLDPSDEDGGWNIAPRAVAALVQPDQLAVAATQHGLRLILAGEGDTRDGTLVRAADSGLGTSAELGRLRIDPAVSAAAGLATASGSRRVHVLDAATLEEIWHSGDTIERLTSAADNAARLDDRSDDKGPEPEGVTVAKLGGRELAFVGLERAGGYLVVDLTPADPVVLGWFPSDADDVSPEGIAVVPGGSTRDGRSLLLAAHEISGSLAVHDLTAFERVDVVVATFNVKELSAAKLDGDDPEGQVDAAVTLLRHAQPDILLLNEIDAEPDGIAAKLFRQRLADPTRPELGPPLDLSFAYTGPVNTGAPSGFDLDRDGALDGPGDAWGFGHYPGQYGMAILSRFPIDRAGVKTFRKLLWVAAPHALIPDGREGRPAWYEPEAAYRQPLSSKSHWDVPVLLPNGRLLHVLAAHPTPPVFDGPEDRNGRRNFDEIRLFADYLGGPAAADWIVDDQLMRGGLLDDAAAVVMGDLNADPVRDESPYGRTAISQLLAHPRICDPVPRGPAGARFDRPYAGDPTTRTNSWGRLDYVLPTCGLEVLDATVGVPDLEDEGATIAKRASDHLLVAVRLGVAARSRPR